MHLWKIISYLWYRVNFNIDKPHISSSSASCSCTVYDRSPLPARVVWTPPFAPSVRRVRFHIVATGKIQRLYPNRNSNCFRGRSGSLNRHQRRSNVIDIVWLTTHADILADRLTRTGRHVTEYRISAVLWLGPGLTILPFRILRSRWCPQNKN